MEALVSKLTENLPECKSNKPKPLDDGQTIIIIGTTGSLGAYMLDRLCKLPSEQNHRSQPWPKWRSLSPAFH
jgi:hypothetical protein